MFCLTDFAQGLSYMGTQYRLVSEVIFRCHFFLFFFFIFFYFCFYFFFILFILFFFFCFAVGVSNLKQQVL